MTSSDTIEKVDKAIKAARCDPGCHSFDSPTDWSNPYCSCMAKARAAISTYEQSGGWQGIDPTQFGDDVAAEMRAYYDEHVGDPWKEGTADNLMLGLLNIVLAAYRPTPPGAVATPLLEQER